MQNRLWGWGQIVFWVLSVLLGSVGWASDSQVSQAHLPEVSTSYVLDEPHVLKPKTIRVLHQLLHEHDQATGEQIVVGVFQSLQGQDLVQWTNQIFQKWELGQKEKDNGVLLALFWQDRQMRLEVGYGLESELTDAQSKLILSEFLKPLLKAGHPDDGLTASVLKILDVLESPLVENGRALEILKSEGITEEQLDPSAYSNAGVFYLLFLIILFVVVVVVAYFSSLDRHISEKGLHHTLIVPPFFGRKPRWSERPQGWDDFFRGGGGTGGWGGGGGPFSGGGGSSGGGGASEKW